MEDLISSIIRGELTLVTKERFKNILAFKDQISNLSGDIVECGSWKGGMSIFLSKVFSEKKLWVCDSFEGCQDPKNGKYVYPDESHKLGQYNGGSVESVKNNFRKYNALDENRIYFLKGWVKDTLIPEICPIKEISLLRVDVDSYSATMEVLDYLYNKVVPGGMIIFDDSCLLESNAAIKDFFKLNDLKYVYDPSDNKEYDIFSIKPYGTRSGLPCGCYFFKK